MRSPKPSGRGYGLDILDAMRAENPSLQSDPRPRASGFYAPLRDRTFRLFWSAAMIGLTSIWVLDVGTAWFMRELTNADPIMVSLIQAAASLPVMLLSLPMGTVGDMWDRRRFLIAAHLWALLVVAIVLLLTLTGRITPHWLVALTALLGVAKAMLLPGLSAVIPELVSRKELSLGVGLYSMANNTARIVGPALGGAIIVAFGLAALYGSAALLIVISLSLLLIWRRPARRAPPSRGFLTELHAGVVHCVQDHDYRNVMRRVFVFFCCAGSVHALLPILVDDPGWFGLTWGAYGVGAVSGAVVFPYLSRAVVLHRQLAIGIFIHAVFLGLLSIVSGNLPRLMVLFVLGMGWFQVMSVAQVSAQMVLPERLRSRGMGAFAMVVMAGVGLGAPVWGFVAKFYGAPLSLGIAMVISLVALAMTYAPSRRAPALSPSRRDS